MRRTALTSLLVAGVTAAAMVLPATGAAADSPDDGTPLAGKTVFLDPGHQQSAAGHDMSRQVDDGYGGTKECQTSGMTALGGTPEYEINYKVAEIVKGALESLGADVQMSRGATGWGGCITDRAEKANESGADLAVSIHADSTTRGEDDVNHGFHLIVPKLPLPDPASDDAQAGGGRAASKIMRDAYKDNGFTPSNYLGEDGIDVRDDVAGPALTHVPLVFVEMGNGSNPADAKVLESAEGQAKNAKAIAVGVATYLAGGDGAVADDAESAVDSTPRAGGDSTPDASGFESLGGTDGLGGGDGPLDAVLDRIDDVMDLFDQVIAVQGIDGLMALVNDENISTVEDLATTAVGMVGPLMTGLGAD